MPEKNEYIIGKDGLIFEKYPFNDLKPKEASAEISSLSLFTEFQLKTLIELSNALKEALQQLKEDKELSNDSKPKEASAKISSLLFQLKIKTLIELINALKEAPQQPKKDK